MQIRFYNKSQFKDSILLISQLDIKMQSRISTKCMNHFVLSSMKSFNKQPIAFVKIQNIKHLNLQKLFNTSMYSFSENKKVKVSSIETPQQQLKQTVSSQPQLIQVSLEQFQEMKRMLNKMKAQISQMDEKNQKQQQNKSTSQQVNQPVNQSSKTKLSEWQEEQARTKQFFFNKEEQKLSLRLMQIHVKEQLHSIAHQYMKKFNSTQVINNSIQVVNESIQENKGKQLQQSLNLLYLIFYRYSTMQNIKLVNQKSLQQLLTKLCQHIYLLQQSQIVNLLLFLNFQIKTQTLNHNFFHQFQQILKKQQILRSLSKKFSGKNSDLIIVLDQFLQGSFSINGMFRFQSFNQDKTKQVLYNPVNLSYLLVKDIKNQQIYQLYKKSLFITKQMFENKYQVQESLVKYDIQKLKFQSLIYFLQNYPSKQQNNVSNLNNNLKTDLISKIISVEYPFQKLFQLPMYKLRIIYSLLSIIQQQQLFNQQLQKYVFRLLQKIIKNEQSLFEQNNISLQQKTQNSQFIYLKKLLMIISQIGIQIYKNYKLQSLNQIQFTSQQNYQIKQILLNLLNIMNKISHNMNVIDFFKQIQQTHENQKFLIIDLTEFQFIVNLNVLFKWFKTLNNEKLNIQISLENGLQENCIQLLKNLIIHSLGSLLPSRQNPSPKYENILLSENTLIMLIISSQMKQKLLLALIDKFQHTQMFVNNENNISIIQNLFSNTIFKNQNHKYYGKCKQILNQIKLTIEKFHKE